MEKRPDAGVELLKVYKKLNPADIKKFDTPLKRGRFAFEITHMEILLAQKNILVDLDENTRKEIVGKGISNFEAIKEMPEHYANFGLVTPALLLGRLMEVNNQKEFVTLKSGKDNLRYFIDSSNLLDEETLMNILTYSKAYLKQLNNE